MSAFGELLRTLRTDRGMTLEVLGASCESELDRRYLSAFELGQRMPTWPTVKQLADALGLRDQARKNFLEVARAEALQRWEMRYEREDDNG